MEKFAFIIHPIDVRRDAARKYPALRFAPTAFIESMMLKMKPALVSHVTGITSATGARAEGWLVGCPLSPRQMLELPHEFVYDRIAAAGKLGAEQGAKIVGLGAFTSVAGDAGISVAARLQGIINVTSGNSYTVYTAIEGLLMAARMLDIDPGQARCAIIGATGSIGAVCAKMLAESVGAIDLVGRDRERLEALRQSIVSGPRAAANRAIVSVSTDLKSTLPEADLVLAVSSSVGELIFPQDLKSGSVVCDVARPRDVSRQVERLRRDVLVIEGGIIEVPGPVEFNFDFGFPPKTAYACMSETMLMALEGTYLPYTLGRDLDVDRVRAIGEIARKHGFKLAGFRAFEKAVDAGTIASVRRHSKSKRVPSPAAGPVAVPQAR